MAFVDPLVGPSGTGAAWDTRRMFDAVQKQTASTMVRQFDSVSARDAEISVPVEGQLCYRTDTDTYEWYNGTAWVSLVTPGAWVSWTPVVTASSVNPTLGTGSVAAGRYAQVGKTVHATAFVQFGTSGVAAGTGTYAFSLPVTIDTSANRNGVVGMAYFQDSSTTFTGLGIVLAGASSGTAVIQYQPNNNTTGLATTLGAAAPWAWAASDTIRFNLTYWAA